MVTVLRLRADGIRRLTREQAVEIYRRDWWLPLHLDQVEDVGVATKVLDMAVNMGRMPATRLLQRALVELGQHIAVDGILGPQTVQAMNSVDPKALLSSLRSKAASYYRGLASRNPKLAVFLPGWLRRASS